MEKLIITDANDLEIWNLIASYQKYSNNINEVNKIIKAYKLAKELHNGVFRKSGDPYIIHPIEVAKIAVSYQVDCDTICACLLHDVVEDTPCELSYIEEEFGRDVAQIVDGVTKITTMDFRYDINKADLFAKNVRKIFTGLLYKDIRIIAVKLFDRVHNMRTMQFMKREKQIEKSTQTIEVFVPLAQAIGANKIKKELQDLCMYYLSYDKYKKIEEKLEKIKILTKDEIEEIKYTLSIKMQEYNIDNEISLRIKNIYNVYISLQKGRTIDNIHDLLALQVNVPTIMDCYTTLGIIHSLDEYAYLQDKFKDYLHMCKTTGYKALHTTIINNHERMLQAQIRTHEMAIVNSKGILHNLRKYDEEELNKLKENYPFFSKGVEIDKEVKDDHDFFDKLKYEILGDKIYVRSTSGKVYEMPVGANIIDFAFLACPARASKLTGGIINGKSVGMTHRLKNQDLVTFTSNDSVQINEDWANMCTTTRARRLILEQSKNR